MDLDKFERFISNSFCNVGQSFYDHYVEANVNFRSKLGMKAVIIRRQLGHCCDWCADLAGIYDPTNAPDNIYRRHRNCKCLVTYKSQDGYQDVWNKKVFFTQRDARIEKNRKIASTDTSKGITTNIRRILKLQIENNSDPIPLSKKIFHSQADLLYEYSKYVVPEPGYDDVYIHGDEYGFAFYDYKGTEYNISVKELADLLRKIGGFENDKIRLCSCDSGALNAVSAQKLADYLGKEVKAPSTILWIYPPVNGISDMIIADEGPDGKADKTKKGYWRTFRPHSKKK